MHYRIVYVSNPFGLEGAAIIELQKVKGTRLLVSSLKEGKSEVTDLDALDRLIELMQRYMELMDQEPEDATGIGAEMLRIAGDHPGMIDNMELKRFLSMEYNHAEAKEFISELQQLRNTKGMKYVEIR